MSYAYLFKIHHHWRYRSGEIMPSSAVYRQEFQPVHDLTIGVEFGARMIQLITNLLNCKYGTRSKQDPTIEGLLALFLFMTSLAGLPMPAPPPPPPTTTHTKRETFNHLASWLEDASNMLMLT
ncbi:Ras-related protein Rab-2-A [Bienertia sinuspersici]